MPYVPQPDDLLVHLWHGASRWEGPPEIRKSRARAYEHGPGLYLTTHLETAQKYAKRNGSLIAMTLRNPRLMTDETVPLADALAFVKRCPGLRHRSTIADGLTRVAPRFGGRVQLNHMIVQVVNNDALGGDAGPAVAAWLVDHGVDAYIARTNGPENWVVVFNPAIIVEHRKVPSRNIDMASADHPPVLDQLAEAHRRMELAVLTQAATHGMGQQSEPVPALVRARL